MTHIKRKLRRGDEDKRAIRIRQFRGKLRGDEDRGTRGKRSFSRKERQATGPNSSNRITEEGEERERERERGTDRGGSR